MATAAETLFEGGGENGARMRAYDWAASPLGPVDAWPESLKTCVRIILTSRQPMFVWWGDALINLYNDAYQAIVGGKHPAALGMPAREVWREIWDQVGPRAESAMRRNEGTYDEALLLIMERHGYPEETYYTFSYSPVPNDQGGTGGILCANVDDTQKIIGERQLSLLRDLASRTSEARSVSEACVRSAESLAGNLRDLPFALLYLADPERKILTLVGSSGISPGTLVSPERPLVGASSLWPLSEVLRTGEPRQVPAPSVLPKGAWDRPAKGAVVLPLADSAEAGPSGVLVVGLNPYRQLDAGYQGFLELVAGQISSAIVNAQRLEEEQRRADALAELDRAKTAFFSNVSHEFRTPLTLMLGPTEDALASPEKALSGEALRTVHRNELRLLKLVNTLLDFARIEAGRVQASYRPTDLAALTSDLASAFRSAIERGGVRFVVDCPPLPEDVYVDREQWEKIVLNLLSNAFKFTFSGEIRISLRAQGGRARLEVSDTGAGIPEVELPRLFERFHRIEGARARTHEGSGIGLALVHDLVELHGGTIRARSALGQGTTFTVEVPLGKAHLPAERVGLDRSLASTGARAETYVGEALRWLSGPSAEDENPAGPTLAPLPLGTGPRTSRLLVADDNADMRDYLTRLLRGHWQVEAVSNGVEALAAALARPPDLILTDVMMPNLDGFGLLRALKAERATASIPVVMLSARAGEESRIEGLEAGADDYLTKPFSAKELLARVSAHLELGRLRRVAELERSKLGMLFAQAPVGIAVFAGPDHVARLANPLYLELIGHRAGFLNKPIREALPELRGQGIYELLDRVFQTGEPFVGKGYEVHLARGAEASAERRFFDFIYQPYRGVDGRVEGIMVVVYEVTAQVLASREREQLLKERATLLESEHQARREAERASRAKDEFLALLGHELRNPLAPIRTAVQLMKLRAGGTAEKERGIIERQVDHLVRLVDDLLDVSRITQGKIELRRERLEISEAVAKGLELASPMLEARNHVVTVKVPREGLEVDGDLARLGQVISNLLTNAAKYTEPGGQIAIVAAREGHEVSVRVRDNGIGISPDLLPEVFEMFVQERQSIDRSQGGLGLGLTIVRSLTALHGGRVMAHSNGRGQGSEFSIHLPATGPAPRVEMPAPAIVADDGSGGLRILVVDDNIDAAETLAEFLQVLGHRTAVAHDGPTALQAAGDFRPQLALLDIGLPVMDGYELARRLRELPGLRTIRLVALTGYGQDSDRRRAKDAGFDAHEVKPVDLGRIEAIVLETRTVAQA